MPLENEVMHFNIPPKRHQGLWKYLQENRSAFYYSEREKFRYAIPTPTLNALLARKKEKNLYSKYFSDGAPYRAELLAHGYARFVPFRSAPLAAGGGKAAEVIETEEGVYRAVVAAWEAQHKKLNENMKGLKNVPLVFHPKKNDSLNQLDLKIQYIDKYKKVMALQQSFRKKYKKKKVWKHKNIREQILEKDDTLASFQRKQQFWETEAQETIKTLDSIRKIKLKFKKYKLPRYDHFLTDDSTLKDWEDTYADAQDENEKEKAINKYKKNFTQYRYPLPQDLVDQVDATEDQWKDAYTAARTAAQEAEKAKRVAEREATEIERYKNKFTDSKLTLPQGLSTVDQWKEAYTATRTAAQEAEKAKRVAEREATEIKRYKKKFADSELTLPEGLGDAALDQWKEAFKTAQNTATIQKIKGQGIFDQPPCNQYEILDDVSATVEAWKEAETACKIERLSLEYYKNPFFEEFPRFLPAETELDEASESLASRKILFDARLVKVKDAFQTLLDKAPEPFTNLNFSIAAEKDFTEAYATYCVAYTTFFERAVPAPKQVGETIWPADIIPPHVRERIEEYAQNTEPAPRILRNFNLKIGNTDHLNVEYLAETLVLQDLINAVHAAHLAHRMRNVADGNERTVAFPVGDLALYIQHHYNSEEDIEQITNALLYYTHGGEEGPEEGSDPLPASLTLEQFLNAYQQYYEANLADVVIFPAPRNKGGKNEKNEAEALELSVQTSILEEEEEEERTPWGEILGVDCRCVSETKHDYKDERGEYVTTRTEKGVCVSGNDCQEYGPSYTCQSRGIRACYERLITKHFKFKNDWFTGKIIPKARADKARDRGNLTDLLKQWKSLLEEVDRLGEELAFLHIEWDRFPKEVGVLTAGEILENGTVEFNAKKPVFGFVTDCYDEDQTIDEEPVQARNYRVSYLMQWDEEDETYVRMLEHDTNITKTVVDEMIGNARANSLLETATLELGPIKEYIGKMPCEKDITCKEGFSNNKEMVRMYKDTYGSSTNFIDTKCNVGTKHCEIVEYSDKPTLFETLQEDFHTYYVDSFLPFVPRVNYKDQVQNDGFGTGPKTPKIPWQFSILEPKNHILLMKRFHNEKNYTDADWKEIHKTHAEYVNPILLAENIVDWEALYAQYKNVVFSTTPEEQQTKMENPGTNNAFHRVRGIFEKAGTFYYYVFHVDDRTRVTIFANKKTRKHVEKKDMPFIKAWNDTMDRIVKETETTLKFVETRIKHNPKLLWQAVSTVSDVSGLLEKDTSYLRRMRDLIVKDLTKDDDDDGDGDGEDEDDGEDGEDKDDGEDDASSATSSSPSSDLEENFSIQKNRTGIFKRQQTKTVGRR